MQPVPAGSIAAREPAAVAALLSELSDLPRERIWRCGAQSVGDAELVALLLGTGTRGRHVLEVARDVVRRGGGLAGLSRASPRELAQVAGIGAARAARITAAFELGRRAVDPGDPRRRLASAADVYRCVAPRLAGVTQEVFLVAGLDVRNGLLDVVEIGRGGLVGVDAHPREVFRPLVRMAAAAGVVIHNHPSGDPTPSAQDRDLTRRLRDAGRVVGIPIVDHVIIGHRRFRSLAEWLGADF